MITIQICIYQFKPFVKNQKKMQPHSGCCPVCGFDFRKYRSFNFNIGEYFANSEEKVPELLQPQVKKFYNDNLYKQIHKKFRFSFIQNKHPFCLNTSNNLYKVVKREFN